MDNLFFTALVVALLTWFFSAACPMFLRWAFHFGAPIVAGFIYGILLGDLPYGLAVGANIMMVYLGLVAVGGSVPNDLSVAGYLGVAMTMLAKQPPEVGLTISVTLGTLGMVAQNAKMSLNSIWVHKADEYAKEGNVQGVRRMNLFASQIIPFILLFIPAFLCVYLGAPVLEELMNAIPQQVINIFVVAGKLLPALGLALLFQQMFSTRILAYLLIGFVLAAFLQMSIMGISLLGIAFGLIHWMFTAKGESNA